MRTIPNYSKYMATEDGRIWSTVTNRFLSPGKDKDGYLQVQVKRDEDGVSKMRKVHRLVAMAFIPNIESKPCIDHIDGNVQNNAIENLRWCTTKENNCFDLHKENCRIAQTIFSSKPEVRERMRRIQNEVCKRPEWIERQRASHSKVKVICTETGEVFRSMSDAARFAKTSSGNINMIVKKKGRLKSIHGYHFELAKEIAAATLTACVTY